MVESDGIAAGKRSQALGQVVRVRRRCTAGMTRMSRSRADLISRTTRSSGSSSRGRLSPRPIKKYHVFLSSIFRRAVRDRILVFNPCDHTEVPKVIVRKTRTVTPQEFERLVRTVPSHYRLLVETFIETGMRWGEVIALRPRLVDFLSRMVRVEDTIVETSKKNSRPANASS